MRILKSFYAAFLLVVPALAQVPTPQVVTSGNVGAIGVPILNSGTFAIPSDANYSVIAVPVNTSCVSCKITSSVSLTATRNVIFPAGRFYLNIENATTGGQAIQIIGASGTGVTIPNGQTVAVWNDGTNFVQIGAAGGGVTTFNTRSGAVTLAATDVAGALTGQTGCSTAGYVYSPQSGTCVATGGGGSLPSGTGLVAVNAGTSALATAAQVTTTLGHPQGLAIFGDSISAYTGVTSPYLGYASLIRPTIGGSFANYAVSGDMCLDSSKWMLTSTNPQLAGKINIHEIGTNDVTVYGSSANLQTVFKRCIAGAYNWLSVGQSTYKVFAGAATKTVGFNGNDPFASYLSGLPAYSTTSGDTLTFAVPVGPTGNVAVDYVIFNGTSGTFTIGINSGSGYALQADPFASGTTFHAYGDGSSTITTQNGTTQGAAGAVFTGFTPNTTVQVQIIVTSSGQPVEPLFAESFPAVSTSNPYVPAVSPNHQNNSNDTLSGTYAGFISTLATAYQGYGANVLYADTRSATNGVSNVAIGYNVTAPGISYTAPGWVSDGSVQYGVSKVPFVKVSSGPAQGQYAVSAGTYTFNVADSTQALVLNYTANCGSPGYTLCYNDTIHPNTLGHAVMASVIASALPAATLTYSGSSTQERPTSIFRPNSYQPSGPAEFWTPNPFNYIGGYSGSPFGEGILLGHQLGNYYWAGIDVTGGANLSGMASVGSNHAASLCVNTTNANQAPTLVSNQYCPIYVTGQSVAYVGNIASYGNATYLGGFTGGIGSGAVIFNGARNYFPSAGQASSSTNFPSAAAEFDSTNWISSSGGQANTVQQLLSSIPAAGTGQAVYLSLINNGCNGGTTCGLDISSSTAPNLLGNAKATTLTDTSLGSSTSPICTTTGGLLTNTGCSGSAHSDSAFIPGANFALNTVIGPVFAEPLPVHAKTIIVRQSGTISCSTAPAVSFLDLGTSASTVYSGISGTVFGVTTGTTDGVYQFSANVNMTPGDYYGFAFTAGTCATAPQFDVTVQVQ